MNPMRADLQPPPERIAALPVSESGYPVPWFVSWIGGKPEFRAADAEKTVEAVRGKRCWVCGQSLGRWLAFVIGPMCGVNGTSGEPPSHVECAEWSAKNCPFLNGRLSKRRDEDGLERLIEATSGSKPQDVGVMIRRQPKACGVWKCREYRPFTDGNGGVLFKMGEPVGGIDWYSQGRRATRDEVDESVRTGLPILEEAAALDGDAGLAALRRAMQKFNVLLDRTIPRAVASATVSAATA